MEKCLDDKKVLKVRRDVTFYFWGEGAIADYHMNSICFLNQKGISIVNCADGTKTINEIVNMLGSDKSDNREEILQMINWLREKGVVIERSYNGFKKCKFKGEKEKFYPKEIIIELTNICNFKCDFCYKDAKGYGGYITDEKVDEIDEILCQKVENIMFTGGEPTLHPSFEKYVNIFTKYAKLSMVTNGSNLYSMNPEILRKFSMIQISLYGYSDEEYEKNTGMKAGYSRVKAGIQLLKDNKIPYAIAVTVSDEVMHEFEKYIITAINLKVEKLLVGVTELFGREKEKGLEEREYKDRREEFIKNLIYYKEKYQKEIKIVLNNIETENRADWSIKNMVYNKCLQCGSGTESWVVSQNGVLRPCVYLPEKQFDIGEVKELRKIIGGELPKEKLCERIREYYEREGFDKEKVIPCNALHEYYEELIKCNG